MMPRRAFPFRWLAMWLCATVLVGGFQGTSWAAPRRDEGKDLADEAAERFKSQRFVDAAELFERAYALNPDKVVRLRNAGRAWEEAGRLDQARHLFRRYVELVPEGADRAEVRLRLARIEARLAPVARPEPEPAVVAEPAPSPAPAPTVVQPDPVAQPRAGAWTLAAAGAAALGVGVAWVLYTNRLVSRYEHDAAAGSYDYATARSSDAGFDKAEADSNTLKLNKNIAWTLTGVGAAATIGGLCWAFWPSDKPPAVAVTPWTSRGEVGIAAAMRF